MIESRIRRLEREAKLSRLVVVGLGVVLLCGAAWRGKSEDVTTSRLTLVDAAGKERGGFRVEGDGRVYLYVNNEEDLPAFQLSSPKEGGAMLSASGPRGGPSWILACAKPYQGKDGEKYPASLWLIGGGAMLGDDVRLEQTSAGGSLVIRDASQAVVFDSRQLRAKPAAKPARVFGPGPAIDPRFREPKP